MIAYGLDGIPRAVLGAVSASGGPAAHIEDTGARVDGRGNGAGADQQPEGTTRGEVRSCKERPRQPWHVVGAEVHEVVDVIVEEREPWVEQEPDVAIVIPPRIVGRRPSGYARNVHKHTPDALFLVEWRIRRVWRGWIIHHVLAKGHAGRGLDKDR